ncbi:MAG: N-6 DNA methylase [Ottowia sp.]|nr:N-6 DNA methylase [Ottowia sp.]
MTFKEHQQQKKAAREFVERWQTAEGSEQQEAAKFWIDLFISVLGIPNPADPSRGVLNFERRVKGRRIDVFLEDVGVLIEHKSRGVDLDTPELRGKEKSGALRFETPFEQAKWYADNLPYHQKPRWIITCNFDEIRIYDLDDENAEQNPDCLLLAEIPEQFDRLSFLISKENSRKEREKQLSVDAGKVVGKLYDALAKSYKHIESDPHEQQSLNILLTRIVFLLYAEDAGLLHEKNDFYTYLAGCKAEKIAAALRELFVTLKTPENQRCEYMSNELKRFPYINGGLFEQDIIIPPFTEAARTILLQEASAGFDWSGISPTIFGAVFESTLNPATRRAGGMHYTSIDNIHKVIDPLFYNALREKWSDIEQRIEEIENSNDPYTKRINKKRKLIEGFIEKISDIRVFDPACGSGNFLTETYICLRRLENRALEVLYGTQKTWAAIKPVQVSIHQFYGVEINNFAVAVAKTALWIAELQMLELTQEILEDIELKPFPLKDNDNIRCANALRMDWNDVLPASQCNYIIGNPPFGNKVLTEQQKKERAETFDKHGGLLDYVACWYKVASDYICDNPVRCAFVSTNSICQGQQVNPLWTPLFESGIHIDFAHRTFVWDSEAPEKAHVYCIIVGFSRVGVGRRVIYDGDTAIDAKNINGYLVDAQNMVAEARTNPLSDVPKMLYGIKPADHGHLLLDEAEKYQLIQKEPKSSNWILPFISAKELIDGKNRYCLWLDGITESELHEMPMVLDRVMRCKEWREQQVKTGDAYKLKDVPHLMRPSSKFHICDYIVIPLHSGERREYIPIAFVRGKTIPANSSSIVPDATVYHFGILISQFHMAWMRVVAGRLESRYRYTSELVYNNFIWPNPTETQRQRIESCAQAVLDARGEHPGKSLAALYKHEKMPANLRAAHHALDAAVEAAYGVNFGGDEGRITARLFHLYAQATASKGK